MADQYSLKNRWKLNITGHPNRLFTPSAQCHRDELLALAHRETNDACVTLLYQRQDGTKLRLQSAVLADLENICLIESDCDLRLLRQAAYDPVIYAVTEKVWRATTNGGESLVDPLKFQSQPLGGQFYSDERLRRMEEDVEFYAKFSETEPSQVARQEARDLLARTVARIMHYYDQKISHYEEVVREDEMALRQLENDALSRQTLSEEIARLEREVERHPSLKAELALLRHRERSLLPHNDWEHVAHSESLSQARQRLLALRKDRAAFEKRKFY